MGNKNISFCFIIVNHRELPGTAHPRPLPAVGVLDGSRHRTYTSPPTRGEDG